jgi:hypothetical protein
MRSCAKSRTNLTWFLDIGILLTLAFGPDSSQIGGIGQTSEVGASINDLGVPVFPTEPEQINAVVALAIEAESIPKLIVDFPTGISPHGR